MVDSELNAAFYDAFNSDPDWSNEERTHKSMYGKYKVKKGHWKSSFSEFGIYEKYEMEDGSQSNDFELYYEFWGPKKVEKDLPFLVLTHGVPVNGREWNSTVSILSRFFNVIVVDLLGMGKSSKPFAFNHWAWRLHARIFKAMIDDMIPGKTFVLGANDWGAGMVQVFAEMYSEDKDPAELTQRRAKEVGERAALMGIILGSAIMLNGYWVQHIGSLKALKDLPYPSPTSTIESVRFAGVFTSLLETMFHRTAEIHNQYSMAPFQETYVEISYGNVKKNPDNTIYKTHAVRVLAEQASVILGNGELLPFHPEDNPNGLKFTRWNVPVLVLWGKNDKMMPVSQVYRLQKIVKFIIKERKSMPEWRGRNRMWYQYHIIKEAGHFAVSDQPEEAAEYIIDFMENIFGVDAMHRQFVGVNHIARQDEPHMMKSLNHLAEKTRV